MSVCTEFQLINMLDLYMYTVRSFDCACLTAHAPFGHEAVLTLSELSLGAGRGLMGLIAVC